MLEVGQGGPGKGGHRYHAALSELHRSNKGAHSKEVGDMVAEGAVVGVFLNGHDLQRIVTQAANARQDVLRKGHVRVDLQPEEKSSKLHRPASMLAI